MVCWASYDVKLARISSSESYFSYDFAVLSLARMIEEVVREHSYLFIHTFATLVASPTISVYS